MPLIGVASTVIAGASKAALPAIADQTVVKGEETLAGSLGRDARVAAPKASGMVNHARFFDLNGDNIVTLAESTQGFEDLKLAPVPWLSYPMALVANLVLGEGVRAPAGTSLWNRMKNLFTVNLTHLAATATEDPIKRVERQMTFDTGNKGCLTLAEIGKWADSEFPDGSGGRTKAGFGQLFHIAADTTKVVTENGVEKTVPAMSRTALEHFYQGETFYDIAEKNGHPHPRPATSPGART